MYTCAWCLHSLTSYFLITLAEADTGYVEQSVSNERDAEQNEESDEAAERREESDIQPRNVYEAGTYN